MISWNGPFIILFIESVETVVEYYTVWMDVMICIYYDMIL